MPKLVLTSKNAFILFIALTVVLLAMGVWWITLMAQVIDEKVELAQTLGADPSLIEQIHQEEISRQMMVGTEGLFFLSLIGFGCYLIYRSLARNEELKFHQQNFLMAVTHELKTPLASMRIYIDTLKSDKIPQERKLTIIPKIKADLERLEKLVENILDAGRFERSGYELKLEEFNLSELLKISLNKLTTYHNHRQLNLKANDIPGEVLYNGDANALGRAIDALLENSLKYNTAPVIELAVSLKQVNDTIILTFTDNGIGIEKDELIKIFDRFYRSGSELNRSQPGSGLGLYLCREIIRAHQGDITAYSDGVGTGATFEIRLNRNM